MNRLTDRDIALSHDDLREIAVIEKIERVVDLFDGVFAKVCSVAKSVGEYLSPAAMAVPSEGQVYTYLQGPSDSQELAEEIFAEADRAEAAETASHSE